jgi:DnaJ-class molecular chaperone
MTCETCDGSGYVRLKINSSIKVACPECVAKTKICMACEGLGRLYLAREGLGKLYSEDDDIECSICKGSGTVRTDIKF